MVGGRDDDIGLFAAALDVVGRVSDARRGVAPCRLAEHLVGLEHGQMFQNKLLVGLVGHHEEVFIGDDRAETLVGASDETLPSTQNIKELLGIVVLAEGPESASDAACHNDAVVVHWVLIVFEKHFSFFAQIWFKVG